MLSLSLSDTPSCSSYLFTLCFFRPFKAFRSFSLFFGNSLSFSSRINDSSCRAPDRAVWHLENLNPDVVMSLLGWRPSLVVWRPSVLGWRPLHEVTKVLILIPRFLALADPFDFIREKIILSSGSKTIEESTAQHNFHLRVQVCVERIRTKQKAVFR